MPDETSGKMDVIDLIITTLQEHEKTIDSLIERMENIIGELEGFSRKIEEGSITKFHKSYKWEQRAKKAMNQKKTETKIEKEFKDALKAEYYLVRNTILLHVADPDERMECEKALYRMLHNLIDLPKPPE